MSKSPLHSQETGEPLLQRLPERLRALADHVLSGKARAGTEPMTAAFPPIHARPDATAVRALLAAAGLPVADLADAPLADFLGCGAGEDLAGAIGLETYGSVALLAGGHAGLARPGPGFLPSGPRRMGGPPAGRAGPLPADHHRQSLLPPARLCPHPARGHAVGCATNRRIRRPVPGERGVSEQRAGGAAGGIRPPAGEGRLTRHWPRYGRGARPGPMGRCAGHTDAPA